MKYYYDLHIHTALSPCAEDEMTPNNIVNMALLKELDVIAVTDHNSCRNARACVTAARGTGLTVIPGMEIETSEETHFVALFPDADAAESFGLTIESRLPDIKNREDIYGSQLILDENDEIAGRFDKLLLNAAAIDISELAKIAEIYGAALFPAHVDRGSNSVISNLGAIPPDLDVKFIEISSRADPETYLAANAGFFIKNYGVLINSDAHRLGDINERAARLEFDAKPTAADVIKRLRNG